MATSQIKGHIRSGKVLWTGTWSSGSITVPNTEDYLAYLITLKDQAIIAIRDEANQNIRGMMTAPTSANQWIRSFVCNYSGNTWSSMIGYELAHSTTGAHSGKADGAVTKIVGLVPVGI